ncbi:carbamoyltransferase HypF [Streptomyces brevispora]|uniref:carbamoyltransferase HypF n=1 Tax=Streptomyces brevispora TaxID=887462 RepID=UPI003717C646
MCLGIPGRVVEIVDGYAGQLALVDVEGARRRVNIGMLDEAPGCDDWVLLHMGFAVELIDRAKAREALSGLEMMGRGRAERVRRRFEVRGVVQGVGFRPFVYVTASELMLTGTVTNTGDGVLAEVEGTADAVDEFGRRLRTDAPPLAVVEDVRTSEQPTRGGTGFTIEESSRGGRGRTLVSPDIATCRDCLDELADAANRRYRHPFITCTHCGPRFTVVTGLPYDRAATTMAEFEMCGACRAEYEDPRDRRFHAQPIACPDCGPRLELVDGDGVSRCRDEDALRAARELLAGGGIIAVKGLGGYHLVCDARDDAAVAELRRRKRRGGKPFAVMVPGLDVARELVTVTAEEEELLTGGRRPIVLLPRRAAGTATGVSDAVAPGCHDLGLLLPYTPLHVLLFGIGADRPGPDALVMTSANLSGEPIVTDDEVALTSLAPLVDAWLRHDRRIHVPCDDSVSRWVAGAELPLRRSRGYAPLPIALPFHVTPTLAVGADLKNACALGEGRYAWLSQHIGDMDDLSTVDALTRTEKHLEDLTGVAPARLVTDRHPGYHSTGWARAHAAGRPVRTAQHHHAHIASVMAEHGLGADESVIGIAFDGTGHGDDGAAWGGEVLVAGYASYRRAAHLGYVPLAGGDASVLRPYRMALAHLHAAGVPWDEDVPAVRACPPEERDVLAHQFTTGFGCVPTSSMGRLFDAVASLTGVRHVVAYEAEAAMELEGLARTAETEGGYRFGIRPGTGREPAIVDPGPVVRAVVSDVRAGVPAALIAARFHASVAALVTELADRCRASTGLDTVALGGGVFQNAVLLEATQLGLTERGFTVLRPRLLPPNDGGIALGQLMIAAAG